MKLKNPLLVVKDLPASIEFYQRVLGLRVILDFGANVTLTGGLCLQTYESWKEFLHVDDACIAFGGNDAEVYFEEDDFDAFAEKLRKQSVAYVHPIQEHSWGQRVVRLYDPDGHILEIGENLKAVAKRFAGSGMRVSEIAVRMDVPEKFVKGLLK